MTKKEEEAEDDSSFNDPYDWLKYSNKKWVSNKSLTEEPDLEEITEKIKDIQGNIDWFKNNYKSLNDWQRGAVKSFAGQLAKIEMKET